MAPPIASTVSSPEDKLRAEPLPCRNIEYCCQPLCLAAPRCRTEWARIDQVDADAAGDTQVALSPTLSKPELPSVLPHVFVQKPCNPHCKKLDQNSACRPCTPAPQSAAPTIARGLVACPLHLLTHQAPQRRPLKQVDRLWPPWHRWKAPQRAAPRRSWRCLAAAACCWLWLWCPLSRTGSSSAPLSDAASRAPYAEPATTRITESSITIMCEHLGLLAAGVHIRWADRLACVPTSPWWGWNGVHCCAGDTVPATRLRDAQTLRS
jgi:hypothetical protein